MNLFPETFEDRNDDGTRLDVGYNGVLRKLQDHHSYLLRKISRGTNLVKKIGIKLRHRKSLEAIQGGTTNWQPEHHPENENDESVEEKRIILKDVAVQGITSVDSNLDHLLTATFSGQRTFLNNMLKPPGVKEILENWPILFNKTILLWHFKVLTKVNMDQFGTNYNEKLQKMLIYGKHKLKLEWEENETEEGRHQLVLLIIQKQFKEDKESLIRSCPFNVEADNLQCNDNYLLLAMRSLGRDNVENEEPLGNKEDLLTEEQKQTKFLLLMDGKVVLKCATFLEALQVLIAAYFVFNKTYPKIHGCTLLFLQMYLLTITTPNTTCRAKSEVSKQKVVTFMRALKNINVVDFDTH